MRAEDRIFTDKLQRLAHHSVQIGSDYLLVFDLVKTQLEPPGEEIFDKGISQLFDGGGIIELFKSLARLAKTDGRLDPILRDVDLFLEKVQPEEKGSRSLQGSGEKPPLHLLRWLSDGEQSFLGRLCLISFLGERETLILLIEEDSSDKKTRKDKLEELLDQVGPGYWRFLIRREIHALDSEERQ